MSSLFQLVYYGTRGYRFDIGYDRSSVFWRLDSTNCRIVEKFKRSFPRGMYSVYLRIYLNVPLQPRRN